MVTAASLFPQSYKRLDSEEPSRSCRIAMMASALGSPPGGCQRQEQARGGEKTGGHGCLASFVGGILGDACSFIGDLCDACLRLLGGQACPLRDELRKITLVSRA